MSDTREVYDPTAEDEEERPRRPRRPRKVKRVAKAPLRCYACGRRLWVTDDDDPDKTLYKHRFSARCSVQTYHPWEQARRQLLLGDLPTGKTKPVRKFKGKKK